MDDQPSAEPTDTALAQAWAAGDERAYDAIVARFAPLVFSRCRRALGAADADDATQAVFLVLARKRDQAAACPALAAWLMMVAGNVVRNAWRDRQRRRNAESSAPPPAPSVEEPTMHGIQEHLDACLAELPAKEREAVVLHHLAGHTLAEVARQTGSGVSTVKDRLNRGLERLRTLLAARGAALTGVALAAFLASEAQAAVPAEVLVHLRDLNPAGGGAGSTAAPSARVVRWSQQKPSRMTRIAIAAAGLLLLGGAAWQFLPSAEPGPSPAPPPVPASKLSGNPLLDLDPEHARSWVVLRVNDGARTVRRLRAQPEMALMPAGAGAVLDTIASLREAVIVGDIDSLTSESERIASYRRQQEWATLPLSEQRKRTGQLIEAAQTEAAKAPATTSLVPAFSGWISGTTADAPLITRLRSTLGGTAPPAGIRADGDGWAYPVATGEVRIAIVDGRVVLSPPAGSPRPPADLPTSAVSPDGELEFQCYLDLGRPGAPIMRMASGDLAIGSDGLRFSARTETASGVTSLPPLDRSCFDRVPAAAILAGAVAVKPGLDYLIEPLQALMEGAKDDASPVPPQAKLVLQSLHTLLKHSDGVILGWIEPGVPVPSLTVEIDLGKAAAAEVLAPTGLVFDDNGMASSPPGPITVTCAWRDGRLIVTTNPAGLDGLGGGGFSAQPEIVRALAALPSGPVNSCLLLRPAATLDLAMPFGAMFVPDLQKPLLDYRMALNKAQSYGFLSLAGDGSQLRLNAGGILALVGCAILAQQSSDPAALLRIAN